MRHVTAGLLAAAALLAPGCAKETPAIAPAPGVVPGQGDYGGVQRADLIGEHVCRATGGSSAEFHWDFTETEFGMSYNVPREISKTLLPGAGPMKATVFWITGKWALDGKRLVLTNIHWMNGVTSNPTPGGEPAPDVTLAPYKTPVVRFDFGETQYVLGPATR